jgi:predicted Zn-dependent peptidase
MDHSVKEIKLPNGANGLLINVPDAKVMSIQLEFRAGEYLVDGKKWEIPHLMEHLLLGANRQYPSGKVFEAEIEKNGANNNASTGVYDIVYKIECADFEWARILNLLLVAITEPLFLADEFKAEFENIQEELIERSDDQFRHLTVILREKFGMVAMTDQKRLKLMKNVDIDDVINHYHRTHTTKNMRFVIAGNLTDQHRHEAILDSLRQIHLPEGTGRFELPDEQPAHQDKPLILFDRTSDGVYFHIDTFSKRRLSVDEEETLNLLNTLLLGTYYSKILGTAREHGVIYDMSSGIVSTKLNNILWIEAQVALKNAPVLFNFIEFEIRNVLNGRISIEDIESAQEYLLGRYQRSEQTVSDIADSYSDRYFLDDVVDDFYQIPNRIKAINKTSVVEVARAVFAGSVWGLGLLGNFDDRFADELFRSITPLWYDRFN